jgi:large repetitive protein
MTLVALLGVLGLGIGVWAAFAAAGPAAPTLTANPSTSPTNSPTETFTFSASGAASYQCSLNGAAFAACTSPKSYGSTSGPLAEGSYSFQVKALDNKGNASSASSYSWVVDRTAPTVSSINRAASNPSNAASLSWTLTFSESVKNVATTNFALAATGLGGTPAITGLSGTGATYTITASTGSGSGSLGLDLTSKGTISDLAGNALGGTVPVTGQAYTIDRTPPPAPSIVNKPPSLTNQTSATFSFSDGEAGVSYLCNLDSGSYAACSNPATFSGLAAGSHTMSVEAADAAGNVSGASAPYTWTVDTTAPPRPSVTGPNSKSDSTAATFTFSDSETSVSFSCSMDGGTWSPCSSPQSYTLLAPGTHEFDVRATDAAGNTGDYNGWKWIINGLSGSGQPFSIGGNASGTLYPGGATAYLDLSLTNTNSVTIYVTSLNVTLPSIAAPNANATHPCSNADFSLTQFTGPIATKPIALPANSTRTLTQLGYSQSQLPTVKMLNRPANQDGCKNATLNFTYSGSAQS